MPLEITRHIKLWYLNFYPGPGGKIQYPTIDKWYMELSKEQKRQVERFGNVPSENSDFFPDHEFE
jgi:hypothetical protein